MGTTQHESEKEKMNSKKFVAYLIAELTWKLLLGLALFWGRASMGDTTFGVLISIIVCATCVEMAYILGQAGLDRFTYMINALVASGHKVTGQPMPGMTITPPQPPAKPPEALPVPQAPKPPEAPKSVAPVVQQTQPPKPPMPTQAQAPKPPAKG